MEISALTRSVVKRTHAIICQDGYINSAVPGWTGCVVNVIINDQMGARFTQTFVTAQKDCVLKGSTIDSQIFFYVVEGSAVISLDGDRKKIGSGHFVYIPVNKDYHLDDFQKNTQVLTFHKSYEYLEGYDAPVVIYGDALKIKGNVYMNDKALVIQELLPSDFKFDMAINIFTYQSGGNLPMVETHVMEHGLLFLEGQGIYRLDQDWYPVKKGDSIWMAPYCQQWFTAMGKEESVYIYYKNVNRFPYQV